MEFEKYFKVLEKYEEKKEKVEKVEKVEKHEWVIDSENSYEVCVKCGLCREYTEIEPTIKYLNNKFHLTTVIVGGKNTRENYVIKKLQKWNNYNYKEVVMNKSFGVIEKICDNFSLTKKVYFMAINKYKNVFLDDKISSRDKIKRCVYVYCILCSCEIYDIDIDIDDLLDYIKVKKKHYLKALKKIDKNNIYFIKNIVESKINICLENNIDVDINDIYNDYKSLKNTDMKINKNSLILFLFYRNINVSNEKFIELFNTTKITIKKFINLEKNIH